MPFFLWNFADRDAVCHGPAGAVPQTMTRVNRTMMIEKFCPPHSLLNRGAGGETGTATCARLSCICVCECVCVCVICFIPQLDGDYPREFWNFSSALHFLQELRRMSSGKDAACARAVLGNFPFFFVICGRLQVDRELEWFFKLSVCLLLFFSKVAHNQNQLVFAVRCLLKGKFKPMIWGDKEYFILLLIAQWF